MLLTLIPLFDENLAVCAYSVFAEKGDMFINPMSQVTGIYDGATYVHGLEAVESMGMETLSDEKEVFVPVTNVSIFSDIEAKCKKFRGQTVILLDSSIPPVPMYVDRLTALKRAGFKLAIRKLAVSEFQVYGPILSLVDYVFLNNKKIAIDKAKHFFGKVYPKIKLVAGNIDSMEAFNQIKATGGYSLYEGAFYRIPVSNGANELTPVKVNYLELLKVVNNPDFELNDAADVIARDPALSLSFLQMINRVVKTAEIKTIKHAAAMLGQRELKKWISTVAIHELYADKPSEITRASILRAVFAEKLAPSFGLANQSDELFLMGLFSLLDVILEKPIAEAVEMIQLSKSIKEALVSHTGKLSKVYEFMLAYEDADWSEVSRVMLLEEIDVDKVYQAYMESLAWYRKTLHG